MKKIIPAGLFLVFLILGVFLWFSKSAQTPKSLQISKQVPDKPTFPLQISQMRKTQYPGSDLIIEETLADGTGYHQFIASYLSQDLKINGLLTVPSSQKPPNGFPVIIFNHGYIPPDQYTTTGRYIAYVDYFARQDYIVFKPDYRGHGNSEGTAEGGYYSPAYTVDVLNALASLKKYPDSNPEKIGMWGHSMGGSLTLRSLAVNPNDIKAAVIWGGVVGTYEDLMYKWRRTQPFQLTQREQAVRGRLRQNLVDKYGSPSASSDFWRSIDPNYYLSDIQTPVQLDAGLTDEEVPWEFSQGLADRLQTAGKTVEFYTYPGADHNISGVSFSLAMQRSLEFFNRYLK